MYKTNHLGIFLLFLYQAAIFLNGNLLLFDVVWDYFEDLRNWDSLPAVWNLSWEKAVLVVLALSAILFRTYLCSIFILEFRIFDIFTGLKWAFLFWVGFAFAGNLYDSRQILVEPDWQKILLGNALDLANFVLCFMVLVVWKKKIKIFTK